MASSKNCAQIVALTITWTRCQSDFNWVLPALWTAEVVLKSSLWLQRLRPCNNDLRTVKSSHLGTANSWPQLQQVHERNDYLSTI